MKALINEGKVIQISDKDFQIAKPLHWIDCIDECKAGWELIDGVAAPKVAPLPTVEERFTALKTDFMTYLTGHYGLGTQGTVQLAFNHPGYDNDTKCKAIDVGTWIRSVQKYYLEKRTAILGGTIETEWDFQQFDATKPIWDFKDFV